MPVPMSAATEARLVRLFSGDALAEARRLLEEDCAEEVAGWHGSSPEELERLRFACLKLSGGTLEGLVEAIVLAQTDWRDALVAAGFGHRVDEHEAWWPQ